MYWDWSSSARFNDPVCYKCKKSGRMAAECTSIHHRKLMMFGFGIPGQGFYSREVKQVDKNRYYAIFPDQSSLDTFRKLTGVELALFQTTGKRGFSPAKPIKVDEFNLLKDEPVRVRANCRDPSMLRGFVEVFFNGVGYQLKFVGEGLQKKRKGKGGSRPRKPDDKSNNRRSDYE
uniref:CCHC-type domain-containing protein n=1 Tax=Setaria italica TaxID=4555 RepID=K3ZNY4_SETIT